MRGPALGALNMKAVVNSLDEIPEHYWDLFTEKNGKFELMAYEGIRTDKDMDP